MVSEFSDTIDENEQYQPDISIVIPTKNAGSHFEKLLTQIDEQLYDGAVEIVVVDSGSEDKTVETAAEHGAVIEEIAPEQFHHGLTRNLGADLASSEVLVFTVQDALPQDNEWLSNLVTPLANSSIGAVYGRQVAFPEAKPMDRFFYSYFYPEDDQQLFAEEINSASEFYLNNVFVSDVAAAVRSETFDNIEFRSEISMSEDKDFALRLLNHGFNIAYSADAVVVHSHDYSIRELFQRRYKDGQAFAEIAGGGDFVRDGLRYLQAELRFLITEGHILWVPYAILYNFVYFLGFELGKLFSGP